MFKRFNKILTIFVMAFVLVSLKFDVFAASNMYVVSDERELKGAVENACAYDYIRMENDIEISGSLYLSKSIVLDLGGHNLYLGDVKSNILIGDKVFSHQEAYNVFVPGYYTNEDEILSDDIFVTKNVWHPGRTITSYRNVYSYRDNVEVSIKNGVIRHVNGLNGIDGVGDSWSDYNGKNGETPSEVFKVISGSLRLCNVCAYGGYGGNGGNGSYQKLIHIPFGGGDAGNGGNGGNGGNVVNLTRKDCNVYLDENTTLIPGIGGKGGRKGEKNTEYWLYSGFRGKNGKNGKSGVEVVRGWTMWQ